MQISIKQWISVAVFGLAVPAGSVVGVAQEQTAPVVAVVPEANAEVMASVSQRYVSAEAGGETPDFQ